MENKTLNCLIKIIIDNKQRNKEALIKNSFENDINQKYIGNYKKNIQ